MANNNYSVHLSSYNEANALQQLLEAASSSLDKQLKQMEADDYSFGEFTITIDGVQTAFFLGGPQFDALSAFIHHIAYENGYEVDLDKQTVVG